METQDQSVAQESVSQTSEPQETQPQQSLDESAQAPLEPQQASTQTLKEKLGEVAKAAKAKSSASQAAKDPAAAVVPAAFQPNFKFKALDKEHEIPELLRGVIKDAESEKSVRELVLKAIGMDHIKPRYQEVRQKYEEVNGAHQNVMSGIQELRSYVKKEDFDSFFEKLEIPVEKILQYAVKKVQFNGLPPEQQQLIEAQRQAELRTRQLEQHNYQLSEQAMAQAVDAKKWSMQMVLQRPDISSFAEAYDKAKGKPGSFQDVVIRTGEAAFHSRQKDLSAEEAVKEAMELIGPILRAQAQAPAAEQQAVVQAPAQTPQSAKKPPVIPNVQGKSSASPAKKAPTSTDDLRKYYKDRFART